MRPIDADSLKQTMKDLVVEGGHKYWRAGAQTTIDTIMPKVIDDEPTIDHTNLVITAKWEKCDYKTFEHGFIETHYGKGIYCTNCRYGFKSAELKMRNFCPSCGAKMEDNSNE